MANIIPTIQQLKDNALRYLQSELQVLSSTQTTLQRENNHVLSFMQAVGLHSVYQYLRDYVLNQAVPSTATGDSLSGWLESFGIPRKTATAATGTVSVKGLANAILTADTDLAFNGLVYIVDSTISLDAQGNGIATVTALMKGTEGNRQAGDELSIVSQVIGIESVIVNDVSRGVEIETDEQAQHRLQQRLSNPPQGAVPSDFERWALTVPGITRAWGLRSPFGPCTAGVIIMTDDNSNGGIPTLADQQAVLDTISHEDRATIDELFVVLPTRKAVNVYLLITPDNANTRLAVNNQLSQLFANSVPGRSLPYSHISAAVSAANGEYSHKIIQPNINALIIAKRYEVLALGEVTFS